MKRLFELVNENKKYEKKIKNEELKEKLIYLKNKRMIMNNIKNMILWNEIINNRKELLNRHEQIEN